MYNVLADFHHAGLLNSLIMLFEGRLGGQLFRPIGMEWAEKGFWKVYDHPATQQQFLGIGAATPDGTPPLNEVIHKISVVGHKDPVVYFCKDIEGDKTNKAITFEGFMDMKFDILIASIPQHVEPFKRLSELHPNHPKVIFQIGNAWTIEAGMAPNIMASANISGVPEGINFISYHQEFDLKTFRPVFPMGMGFGNDNSFTAGIDEFKVEAPDKNISSFVNVFNAQSHFASDWALFTEVEKLMPEWNFKSYGGQCRDGSKDGTANLAEAMIFSRFIWHTKNGGDGYGHVLHNAAAVGKPLIVKKEYYTGKMGEKLLIDGVTCLTIDGLSAYEIKNKINVYNEPNVYGLLCQQAYLNFKEIVDFDKEFEQLKVFLNNLI